MTLATAVGGRLGGRTAGLRGGGAAGLEADGHAGVQGADAAAPLLPPRGRHVQQGVGERGPPHTAGLGGAV